METNKYLELIKQELANMPDFVKEYNLGTSHSLTTTYQYLTEIRRFFDWLKAGRDCLLHLCTYSFSIKSTKK